MEFSRQKLGHYLRQSRFLQVADFVFFLGDVLKNRSSNKAFLNEHPDFIPIPAHLAYDAYNHTNLRTYYEMGRKHSELISDLINTYLDKDKVKICEWGCGPARVIRHLNPLVACKSHELYGTDYNQESIDWCKQHIRNVCFVKNNLKPPMPLESGQFDCIYALSVFTHLSEDLHYAWMDELARLLNTNGILIFTTHGDLCADRLLPEEKELYHSGQLVIRGKIKEGKKHFSAYHPPQFIRDHLLKNFVVLTHLNNVAKYHMEQDVWCVRKVSSSDKPAST